MSLSPSSSRTLSLDDLDEIPICSPSPTRELSPDSVYDSHRDGFADSLVLDDMLLNTKSIDFAMDINPWWADNKRRATIDDPEGIFNGRKAMSEPVTKEKRLVSSRSEDRSSVHSRRRALEGLLSLIHGQEGHSRPCSEKDVTDTLTDTSFQSDSSSADRERRRKRMTEQNMQQMDVAELASLLSCLEIKLEVANAKLMRAVRQRGHQLAKLVAKNALVTAVLHAMSDKTSMDAQLRFSLSPPLGEGGGEQWKEAMRAVARLPGGIPDYFRVKLWTTLASQYLCDSLLDWSSLSISYLSEKILPSDDQIHSCIIKDLHRTGCADFTDERKLKQLLLGYARHNAIVGYCQGFNIIGALILHVMEYNVEGALKVFIFLVEGVLPSSFFDNSLRALSVDIAVLKDLLLQRLPRTVDHMDRLQANSGNEYEPPLTNVFSVHWLLTLFATILPRNTVLRVWDGAMLEGNEVMVRTAIALWARISRRVLTTKTADEFYVLMDKLSKRTKEMSEQEQDNLMTVVYSMSPFPYPGMSSLREKYTWDIQPFSSSFRLFNKGMDQSLGGEDSDGEGTTTGCSPCSGRRSADFAVTSSQIQTLRKQYRELLRRQKEATVVMKTSSAENHSMFCSTSSPTPSYHSEPCSPTAMFNHLQMAPALAKRSIEECQPTTFGGAIALAPSMVQPLSDGTGVKRNREIEPIENSNNACLQTASALRHELK